MLLDLPFALKVRDACLSFGSAHGTIHKMLAASGFSGVRQVFPLPDLTLEANLRQPEILHTEHAVYALQSRIQRSRIFHIALDNLGPGLTQRLDCWFAHVA